MVAKETICKSRITSTETGSLVNALQTWLGEQLHEFPDGHFRNRLQVYNQSFFIVVFEPDGASYKLWKPFFERKDLEWIEN